MPSRPQPARPTRIPGAETGQILRKMYDLPYASLSPAQKVTHELTLNSGHGRPQAALSAPENVEKVLDCIDRALSR